MTGKSKVINTHSHKYPIRPKIPQQQMIKNQHIEGIRTKIPEQHYHGNCYNNTHIHKYRIRPKIS
jgi:hypothetical protein